MAPGPLMSVRYRTVEPWMGEPPLRYGTVLSSQGELGEGSTNGFGDTVRTGIGTYAKLPLTQHCQQVDPAAHPAAACHRTDPSREGGGCKPRSTNESNKNGSKAPQIKILTAAGVENLETLQFAHARRYTQG